MILLLLLTLLAPSTAPATQPSTLAKGDFVYPSPTDGWVEFKRTDDGNGIIYKWEDGAFLQINLVPATSGFTKEMSKKMGNMICQQLLKDAQAKGYTLLQPPSIEDDGRFILKIRHRFLQGDVETNQVQVYREVGNFLVNVAISVRDGSEDQVKTLQGEGEALLLAAKSAKQISREQAKQKPAAAGKPITLPQAKIRVIPPADWIVENKDAAEGVVATLRDAADATNLIAISVRPLPAEAKRDPKLREVILDEMARGESQQFTLEGATLIGEIQVMKDSRFLRKTRTKYETKDVKFQILSRQIRVGDAMVSVTCLALDDAVGRIDKTADEVAIKIRPAVRSAE